MRILLIGAGGTIGKRLLPVLQKNHEVITAGRSNGDIKVDVTSEQSIKELFNLVDNIDGCICVAASGPLDDFETLTEAKLKEDIQGKLFGQINLVLIGQKLQNNIRINAVSPSMIEDSATTYQSLFPGLKAVSMQRITDAFSKTVEENITGKIIKVY